MITPKEMNFIGTLRPGGPEVMQLNVTEVPQPADDEVLLRVLAAGVNFPDIMQRRGLYPAPPGANPVLGLDVAGEVVGKGKAVDSVDIGDKVCALTNGGGYAEYCVAPYSQCLPWPEGYDAIQAAALPETYFTVWANLFQIGRFKKRESVIVHGGAGGIGITAIQLAKEFGGRVFATEASREKCGACVKFGAEAAFNFQETDFAEEIRKIVGDRGVDVVLDIVGAPYTQRNLDCLAMDGRLIQISIMQGSKVQIDLRQLMSRRLSISGSMMRPRTTMEKGRIAAELRESVWPILNAGRCHPVIQKVFPLAEASEAHRLMESNLHIGKIMLKVAT
ncbi:MAG: NAD(P)H-quinone oxidoreductase [Smithellaceae bacterium]|nr:NAD(P)H-quinone oxidoreductase [Smithellaceae bacterium]